jgi:hypothetical protein
LTIEEPRQIALRPVPRAVFDYADGAAEGEVSLSRARQAFEDVNFRPSVLDRGTARAVIRTMRLLQVADVRQLGPQHFGSASGSPQSAEVNSNVPGCTR